MNHTARSFDRTGGLLLAGGRSERFGAEKAVALFRGRTLMDLAAARLAQCAALVVSARPESAAAARAAHLGVEVVHDDPGHPAGPLAGVSAGLDWAAARGFEQLATAPCDCPALPENLVARLLAGASEAPAAFAVTVRGMHPLCAVWSVELRSLLAATLRRGVHPAVHTFLSSAGARRVHFDDAAAFANANTPDELARLEQTA